jgi:predicted dehydrogenase
MAVRVALIGAGGFGKIHAAVLRRIPEAEFVAVASRNEENAREAAGESKARVYADWQTMLETEKPEAVIICTPPHVHGEIELACAERVRGVFVEKPVANNARTARRIADAFRKKSIVAGAAYQTRYRRSVARAKELLSDPENPPILANGWWVGPMPPPAWWRAKELSGGQMNEQTTHGVDLARYLVGEIDEVFAFGARGFVKGVEGYTVEDAVTMSVRYRSGAVGCFYTGCFQKSGYESGLGNGLVVCSATVRIELAGWKMGLVASREKGSPPEKIDSEGEDAIEIEDRAFLRAVAERKPELIRTPYDDAARTVEVCMACNESLARGKAVRVR